MKIFNYCLKLVVCFVLLLGVSSSLVQQVSAKDNEIPNFTYDVAVEIDEGFKDVSISSISPKWWPGNPNPPYGSEAWLFQNYGYNYGASAPKKVTEKCGRSAVIGGVVGGSSSLFYTWWKGFPITLGVFVAKFGVAAASSYAACLVENGIKK
ncbi:MAG: hypothetical protein ACRDCN_10835 [Tannerellaceae bacterium]